MIVSVEGVSKRYALRGRSGLVQDSILAVSDVSFSISAGETLAIVGESGCGKSTTARIVLGLESPSSGQVLFGNSQRSSGKYVNRVTSVVRRAVFQNPWSSLNPRRRIGSLMLESLGLRGGDGSTARDRIVDTLQRVGLSPTAYDSYAHQLSGGQRQRAAIAIAIVGDPELIVLDEPVSALDVSIRGQITNLLVDLQEERGCAYLLISHDMLATRVIADRVAVMYLGSIVEMGRTGEVLSQPRHHYTKSLMDAEPCDHPADRGRKRILIGEVPSAVDRPSGCPFHPRCPAADGDQCTSVVPTLAPDENGRSVACHYPLV